MSSPTTGAAGPTYRDAFRASNRNEDLTTILKSTATPQCRECQGLRPHITGLNKGLNDGDRSQGLAGLMCAIPDKALFPAQSVVHQQDQINNGAFKHPALILCESACTHQVFVAPMTSFGGQGIEVKYAGAHPTYQDRMYSEYLAIGQPTAGTKSAGGLPSLQLRDGRAMPKLSYVHLDLGYWIEWRNLSKTIIPPYRLTAESLIDARWAYAVCEKHRQEHGSRSRFGRRSPSPPTPSASTTAHRGAARAPEVTNVNAMEPVFLGYLPYAQMVSTPTGAIAQALFSCNGQVYTGWAYVHIVSQYGMPGHTQGDVTEYNQGNMAGCPPWSYQ